MDTQYSTKLNQPLYSKISHLPETKVVSWAREIIDTYNPTDFGNNSGKFFSNYEVYWFHKSSNLPLIKYFLNSLKNYEDEFEKVYGTKLELNLLMLTHIRDASQPSCIFHRDGYFWDGIFHLSILGNSKIEYSDEHKCPLESTTDAKTLSFPNGSIWFFNSSKIYHRIGLQTGERIELCAPRLMREDYVNRSLKDYKMKADGFLDGTNKGWLENKAIAKKHILSAAEANRASNNTITRFVDDK